MKICCGSTYITSLYATFERGDYSSLPTTDDLRDAMNWAASAGFQALELEVLTKRHLDTFDAESLRSLTEALDSSAVSIPHVSFPFIFHSFPDTSTWRSVKRDFERCVEVTGRVEAEVIQLTSAPFPGAELTWDGPYPGGPPANVVFHRVGGWKSVWGTFVESVGQLCDMAKAAGLKLAMEPRPREVIGNTDAMLALLRDVGSSDLGTVFDTGHHFVMKEVLPVSIWKLANSIASVQLSDNDGIIEHHWAPGEGRIDFESVLRALNDERYGGYLAIESSGVGRRASDFVKARLYVEDLLGAVLGETVGASQKAAYDRR
ncbi:MAG: sugar phosphate isomerase/epimerase [Nitrososphaerota archaeon]|nr:sugar phosphate isomerase/epimerase [Nitrososphaerota archaeon]